MKAMRTLLALVFLLGAAFGLRAGEAAFEVRAVAPGHVPTGREYVLDDGGGDPVRLSLGSEVLLDAAALASAEAGGEEGAWTIAVELTPAGRARFAEVTAKFLNQRLAILINDKVRCAPVVSSAILDGSFQIGGNFTAEEVRQLAADLSAAARKEAPAAPAAPAATPGTP